MNISYNVYVPEVKRFGAKSEEAKAIDAFLGMKGKRNMCLEYDTPEQAKSKAASISSRRRSTKSMDKYDIIRSDNRIYIVRKEGIKNGSN